MEISGDIDEVPANLNLRIEDDFITLEDDDRLIMKFEPGFDNNIALLEQDGEYIRYTTTIIIKDNDSESS